MLKVNNISKKFNTLNDLLKLSKYKAVGTQLTDGLTISSKLLKLLEII